MCGFVFLHDPMATEAELNSRVSRGLKALQHRGPDDSGQWSEYNTAMGHQRLSIIDLTASRQPMDSPDGRFVLAYNGEIYNYRELRKSFEGRWDFRSYGDTEVLLAGLVLHGADFLLRCEGMWSFALWDRAEERLLLARDRMGKKPLYYGQLPAGGICCGSELPALRALGGPPRSEDLDSTADYLRYGFYLPGTTAYVGVREVLPGHLLRWAPGAIPEEKAYWILPLEPFRGSEQKAATLLHDRLVTSVKRRLVADVEVGSFLSGGIDSSLVTAVAAEHSGRTVKSFTIGFSEQSYDERPFARLCAQHVGTNHYEEVLETLDAEALEEIVFNHVGQPFGDPSILPTAMVSRLAARHVKVALSGDGGDEVFSGYQRYQARVLLRWYTRLPKPLRKVAERTVRTVPESMAHHSRSILKKARLFVESAARSESEYDYVAPRFYSSAELRALAPELASRGHKPPGLPDTCQLDDVHRMMAMDALVYLPQDILLKVDRASMAYSLETRAPFLDSAVIALAFSLPRHWHRRGFSGKRMLRQSFGGTLPSTLWRRRKQGFGVPVSQWFKGGLSAELEELASKPGVPIDAAVVRGMTAQHRRGTRDFGLHLWGLFCYLLWRQRENRG